MNLNNFWNHIENLLLKINSRKFVAWVVATIAFFTNFLNENNWLMITMLWMGVQGVLDYKTQQENNNV